MWISKRKWTRIMDRIERLEGSVRDIREGERIYVNGGQIHPWYEGKFRITEAINLLAKHVGFQWKIQSEIAASIEGASLGKGGDHG